MGAADFTRRAPRSWQTTGRPGDGGVWPRSRFDVKWERNDRQRQPGMFAAALIRSEIRRGCGLIIKPSLAAGASPPPHTRPAFRATWRPHLLIWGNNRIVSGLMRRRRFTLRWWSHTWFAVWGDLVPGRWTPAQREEGGKSSPGLVFQRLQLALGWWFVIPLLYLCDLIWVRN